MKKFDFLLTRDKTHYLKKMQELEDEYARRERIIGKDYIRGLHIKPQGEELFGHYSAIGYSVRGYLVPFRGKFEISEDGTLHFRGCTYPYLLPLIFNIIFLLLVLFVAQRADFIVASLVLLVIQYLFFIKYSKILLKLLEEFFV